MNTALLTEYRRLRQDRTGRYAGTGKIYHYKAPAHQALKAARYKIDVTQRWEDAEDAGLVRLRTMPDELTSFSDLAGDCFNPTANPDIQPHVLERQRKQYIRQINREGVWILQGQYRCPCCGSWRTAESVAGLVGDDWRESGYDLDIMDATLAALN